MRVVNRIFVVLMWAFLGFFTLINVGAAIAIAMGENNKFNYVALLIPIAMMVAACVLYAAVAKKRIFWIILAAVGAIIMLLVSLELKRAFPVHIDGHGNDAGMTTWNLVWRHTGIVVVPVFMLAAWLFERKAEVEESLWQVSHGSQYNLGESSNIFKDDEDDALRDELPPRKMKRSVKNRTRKEN